MTARRVLRVAAKRRRAGIRTRRLATVAALVATALVAQTGVISNAAWNDSEWTHANIGTTDCTDAAGDFATRGEGRALSGSVLGIDLDTVAQASGTVVTNDGARVQYSPTSANEAGPDAYANPLEVEALSAVNVDLGQGLLQLPLDNSTGVLGQYGQARSAGEAVGAGGFVTSSGGIATASDNGYPELAELKLSTLLAGVNPTVASLLTNVTDVSLETGAVAGRASLDACELAWAGGEPEAQMFASSRSAEGEPATQALASALTREYVAADVRTVVSSPTVGALVTGVTGVVDRLDAAVAGLAGDQGLLNDIGSGISGLLSVLQALRVGEISVGPLQATIDLTPVTRLLTGTLTDSSGIVQLDLAAGTIGLDTAALVSSAYSGTDGVTLNGLPPNTNLLSDPRILTALTGALTETLNQWLGNVQQALSDAVAAIQVKLAASVRVSAIVLPLVRIDISVDASLSALKAGSGVSARPSLLGLEIPLLDGVLSALTGGLGAIVVGLIEEVVLPIATSVTAVLNPLIQTVVSTVSNVYNVLYLDGIVSIVVNAQNDPLTGGPEPVDWQNLPPGQFDVAALRIGVLDAAGASGIHLYLGRGSVGPGCSVNQAVLNCPGY